MPLACNFMCVRSAHVACCVCDGASAATTGRLEGVPSGSAQLI